jgi:hypothetical protein
MTLLQRDLWIGLILTADDQGRMLYDPALIRSDVWPRDDISLDDVSKNLNNLCDLACILIYENSGEKYIQILNWQKYQSHAEWLGLSKFPAPIGWEDRYRYQGKKEEGIITSKNWKRLPTSLPTGLPSLNVKDKDKDYVNDNDKGEEEPPPASFEPVEKTDWKPEVPLNRESFMYFEKADELLLDGIFYAVTTFYPSKQDADLTRKSILAIAERHKIEVVPKNKEKIAEVLRPYYLAWCKRKGRNGNNYSKTSIVWLTEWAMVGEIPPEAKTKKTVADMQRDPPPDPKKVAADIIAGTKQPAPVET